MFNNAAFNVVIGMVLIYLLYSLLVTIVGEMLATWMGLRSRILRVAIEKMLNDGYFDANGNPRYYSWWHFLQRFFLKEFEGFSESFAGKFYQQASIKYLSSRANGKTTAFTQTKPSYISDTNFAHTLTAMLTEKGVGATAMEKINYCLLHNICHVQPQTLAHLQRLASEAGTDVELFATKLKSWFNETNDRATGWYKRKLQLILFWLGFVIAAAFNVDSIQIARFLAKDEDARNNLTSMAVAVVKDSASYRPLLGINGDSLLPKDVFDTSMALVKRDIKQANLILGLGWGLDTITQNCQLSFSKEKDNATYMSIKQNHYRLVDTINPFFNRLNGDIARLRKKMAKEKEKLNGWLGLLNNPAAQKILGPDSVAKMNATADTEQRNFWQDSLTFSQKKDSLLNIDTLIDGVMQQLNRLTERKLLAITHIDSSKSGKLIVHGKCTLSRLEKAWYVICQIPCKPIRLLGFIITALMLSLGAPFWFDLLKKLVALRGAGVKPEEKIPTSTRQETVNSAAANNPLLRNAALPNTDHSGSDANEAALESMTQKLKNENAVVAIGLKQQPNTQPPSTVVEVMVKDAAAMTHLQQKYGSSETVLDGIEVGVVYTIASMNVYHGSDKSAMMGSEVGNQSKVLGQGTLGCFLRKKGDSRNYLISCWHVLKDNTQWDLAPLQKNITQGNTVIGSVVDGCLTNTIDVGIATYTLPTIESNNDIKITGQQRAVQAFDSALSTPVKLFGTVCRFKEAVIIHHKINAQLKYPDQLMHSMVDLFSIAIADSATGKLKAPTGSGDSGAVVTDMDGLPLGMIIGGNDTLSYAVKFTNILNPSTPYTEYSFIINA